MLTLCNLAASLNLFMAEESILGRDSGSHLWGEAGGAPDATRAQGQQSRKDPQGPCPSESTEGV